MKHALVTPLLVVSACYLPGEAPNLADHTEDRNPPETPPASADNTGLAGADAGGTSLDGPGRQPCQVLDFDRTADGNPIARGDILVDSYAADGIHLRAWRNPAMSAPGLPVAFDTDNPTGGDIDLAFAGLGNALISQQSFSPADIIAGSVAEPNDDGSGARFELVFQKPHCVTALTLLDIDANEAAVRIRLYDDSGALVVAHDQPGAGDNRRLDTTLPATELCTVSRMTVDLSGSGALDNLVVCQACPDGGLAQLVYLDADADGFGDPSTEMVSCGPPLRYVETSGDCDDTDDAISPVAAEQCDGVDNNCNATTDEPTAVDAIEWYLDRDGDGYGDVAAPVLACEQPTGTSISDDDCDDSDSSVHPGAADPPNGRDDDCSGTVDG